MKKNVVIFFLLLSLKGITQMGFPVSESNDRDWVIRNEADQWTNVYSDLTNFSGTALPAGTAMSTTPFFFKRLQVPAGQIANLRSITFTATVKDVQIHYFVSKSGLLSTLSSFTAQASVKFDKRGVVTLMAGTSVTVPFGGAYGYDIYENGGLAISCFNTTDNSASNNAIVAFDIDAPLYTSDPYFSAKKLMTVIGDSKGWTSFGNFNNTTSVINFGDTHYSSRVANILRKEGKPLRVSRRAFGGSTSQQVYGFVLGGAIDRSLSRYKGSNIVIIDVGTNDANNAAATVTEAATSSNAYNTTYRQRIEAIIAHVYQIDPAASIILMGVADSDITTNSRNTNIAGYRTQAAAIVSEGGLSGVFAGKDLRYYDESTGLTVNDTNYTEQGAGTHLHPRGDTGHAIIATGNVNGAGTTGLLAVVKATTWYTN